MTRSRFRYKKRSGEHQHQSALFSWAALNSNHHPELACLYAIPNAAKRSFSEGARMRNEGLKKGMLDICLPVGRGGFYALYIEMKYGKNKLTKEQKEWVKLLSEEGNLVRVCYDWEEAKNEISEYLKARRT